ncbi:MAG: HD-GYP domain-containing protein [Sedimenticola sp.]
MPSTSVHAETHFLEVLEARSNVFRIIYDTVIEIEGASEEKIYATLCRNLRRIFDADYCALAGYDSGSSVITLRAIDERDGISTTTLRETAELTPEFEALFKSCQVQECEDMERTGCLVNLFPGFIELPVDAKYLYVTSVREDNLLAIGLIGVAIDRKIKMKDLIEVYLNMAGMSIQRVNALNALTTLNDELAHRVEERTMELRQSYRRLQELFKQTIQGLASALEMLDPYTAGHQRRVAAIAVMIAEEMGLPQERIDGLSMAASVHDIGKISIPSQILSKPGRLLPEEFSLIKTHSQAGYNILERIDFPWPAADIVAQHHEQCDGSGYPNGLSADEILLEAKIIAVADVFEAMTAHRPYRPSLGTERAIRTINDRRGSGFDVEVVDAFLKLLNEGRLEEFV